MAANYSTRSVIERTLDDAIGRLSEQSSAEARALLAEARRMRGVLVSWRDSPPEAETRRELLAEVMRLATEASEIAPPRSLIGPEQPALEPRTATPVEVRRATPPVIVKPGRPAMMSSATNRAQPSGPWATQTPVSTGITLLRASTAAFRPYALLAGASVKLLRREGGTGIYVAVVRMSPMSELPRHRHFADEEMYMLEGAADVGGSEALAGDYVRAEAGSVHEVIRTSTGCTFLLVGSERDEILPP